MRSERELKLLHTGKMKRMLKEEYPYPKLPLVVSYDHSLSDAIERAGRAIKACSQATEDDFQLFQRELSLARSSRELRAMVLLKWVEVD